MIFALVVEKPLQDVGAVVVFSLGSVVGPGDSIRQQNIPEDQQIQFSKDYKADLQFVNILFMSAMKSLLFT